jgi:hypothetical protein
VSRVYLLTDLIAQQLQGKFRCIGSYGRPVYQQSVWFIDGDEMLIAVYDL